MSVPTFLSFAPNSTPASTPEPKFSTICQKNMAAPTFDEHLSATNGGGLLGVRKNETCTLRTHRARTLSNVSCVSNSTWWSAVASVSSESHDQHVDEQEEKKEPKAMAVARKMLDSGVALENVQERRESIKSTSTSRSRQNSGQKENERSPSTRDIDANLRPKLQRQGTSSSAATAASSRRSSRRRPSTSMEASNVSSSGTTLQGRPSSSGTGALTPPASSGGQWQQWSWDSAQAITEARRLKRLEIKQSLTQKYPNDRVHGEFLPFSTGFAHSTDSLSPVRFLPRTASSNAETMVASRSTPATPLEPTTIAWKDLEALRAEYAAVDKRKRSPWTWIRQRVLCGAGILGCGGKKEFWEDGDEDRGSVRRYRLELPDRDETCAVKVPVRVRSVDIKPADGVGAVATKRLGQGLLDVEEEKEGKERWSTVGICEGKGVDIETMLPEGFRESEAATPVLGSTVRGVV
jgi:hypothetical protein